MRLQAKTRYTRPRTIACRSQPCLAYAPVLGTGRCNWWGRRICAHARAATQWGTCQCKSGVMAVRTATWPDTAPQTHTCRSTTYPTYLRVAHTHQHIQGALHNGPLPLRATDSGTLLQHPLRSLSGNETPPGRTVQKQFSARRSSRYNPFHGRMAPCTSRRRHTSYHAAPNPLGKLPSPADMVKCRDPCPTAAGVLPAGSDSRGAAWRATRLTGRPPLLGQP
mmetsp:Transcript_97360/g.303171  ORF Transcript_97360/g.303171 Transcript_97360/m.303171 type:complete len:222 (+) Transcript_97360:617-1282(+)